jgi:O-antigen ligase
MTPGPDPSRNGARGLALALVLLLAGVTLRFGGYDPWAGLALEWGSSALVVFTVFRSVREEGENSERRRTSNRAWQRLSFWVRHPDVGGITRILTLGRFPARPSTPEVEIYFPGTSDESSMRLDPAREVFVLGYRFKRTGLLVPVTLISLWIALSLVPLGRAPLSFLSPEAGRSLAEAASLLESKPGLAPWTLAPFPTFEGLWMWLAVVGLFHVALRIARSPRGAAGLGLYLLALGAASGALGIAGWLSDLHDAFGKSSEALRATGSFGNPNHFAAFQSMLLLVSLGWLGYFRERTRVEGTVVDERDGGREGRRARPPRPRERWNDRALLLIAGLGVVLLSLGLLLSLSRSGISFALAGALAYVLLTRAHGGAANAGGRSTTVLWLVALAVAAFAVWLGTEPVVERFAKLGEQWEREGTRVQVWRDSVPAVASFWLTGSGLGSFRYVGARYRTFGGRIFYSWAHNDYLQLLIELGVPGFLLFLWMALAVFRSGRRARRSFRSSPALESLHAGYAGAIVAIGLHSFTDFGLHIPSNLALLAIVVGAVVGMGNDDSRRS